MYCFGFPGGSMVKNPPVMQGDIGHAGSVSEWEDLLEKEMATNSTILAWKISRTEEPSRLQSMGHKESDMTEQLHFLSFQYFCLENLMESDGLQSLGSLWATKHSHTWPFLPSKT